MCTPKAPKIKPEASKTPDPAVIRNPYFDGALDLQQTRQGRNSLRIDPGIPGGVRIPTPTPFSPVAPAPAGRTPRPGSFLSGLAALSRS